MRPGETWTADEALEQLYAAHWRSLVRLSVLLRARPGRGRGGRAGRVRRRCTAAGRGCATPTRRSPTCARRSSTGPARRCGTAAWSSGTPPAQAPPPDAAPGRRRRAGRGRRPPSSTRCARSPAAARGAGAALLPGPVRGRDRRRARHRPRRGEEPTPPAAPRRSARCSPTRTPKGPVRTTCPTCCTTRSPTSSRPTGSPRSGRAPRRPAAPAGLVRRRRRGARRRGRSDRVRASSTWRSDTAPRRTTADPDPGDAPSRRTPTTLVDRPVYYLGDTPGSAAVPRVRPVRPGDPLQRRLDRIQRTPADPDYRTPVDRRLVRGRGRRTGRRDRGRRRGTAARPTCRHDRRRPSWRSSRSSTRSRRRAGRDAARAVLIGRRPDRPGPRRTDLRAGRARPSSTCCHWSASATRPKARSSAELVPRGRGRANSFEATCVWRLQRDEGTGSSAEGFATAEGYWTTQLYPVGGRGRPLGPRRRPLHVRWLDRRPAGGEGRPSTDTRTVIVE